MRDSQSTTSKLDEILAEFVLAEENGKQVNRDDLVEQHPELATELKAFFADRDQFKRLASPLSPVAVRHKDLPAKVRYFGDYELLQEIAQGGMGIVYKARQTSLNRIVAIKMILAGHLASDADVRRFTDEARTAASLKHEAIVPIHEVGKQDGQHYFSMDLIEGRSLAEVLRTDPPAPEEAARIIKAVAEAVDYAHGEGIVHRDIKPSNILIADTGQVHITDFGLALRVEGESELTRTGQVLGTPAYMPPEQARGLRDLVGPGSDIYALGAVLYELLASGPPFRGKTAADTIRQLIDDNPRSPRQLKPKIPRDLETICLKCLEKEPHQRYGTASLLADDLGRYLSGQPIHAGPVGHLERLLRWSRREPTIASLTAAVLLLLILSTCVSTYFAIKANKWASAESAARLAEAAAHYETDRALFESYLDRARAGRSGKLPGRKIGSQLAIRRAADLGKQLTLNDDTKLTLRNEAIAVMAVDADIEVEKQWVQSSRLLAAAFDPGLEHYAVRCDDSEVEVRRVADNVLMASLPPAGTYKRGDQIEFSPDGELLALRPPDSGKCQVWDWRRKSLLFEVNASQRRYFQFAPDGQSIAVFDAGNKVCFYEIPSGEKTRTLALNFTPNWPYSMSFHPNGRLLAFADGKYVDVVDIESGARVNQFSGARQLVYQIAWDRGGSLLAAGSADCNAYVWDVETNELRHVLQTMIKVIRVKFGHCGDMLVTSDYHSESRFWNLATGRESFSTPGIATRFSRGDQRAAYFHNDKVGTWHIERTTEYQLLYDPQSSVNWPRSIDFSSDGRILVSGGPKGVQFWQTATGRKLAFLPIGHTYSVFLRPTARGHSLVTSGSDVHRWTLASQNANSGLIQGPPDVMQELGLAGEFAGSASYHGGRYLSLVSEERHALIVDMERVCDAVVLNDGRRRLQFAAISPDGRFVVTTGKGNRGVWLWDGRTGEKLRDLWPDVGAGSVSFSADGKWLLVSAAGAYRLWQTKTWRVQWTLMKRGKVGTENPAAFSADAKYVAVTVARRGLQLIDTQTSREIATFDAADQPLWGAAFSTDNHYLVTYGNRLIGVWDMWRIQRRLAEMGLNWDAAQIGPSNEIDDQEDIRIDIDLGELNLTQAHRGG